MIKSLNRTILLRNIPFNIEEERILRELRIPRIRALAELPEKNLARDIKKAIDLAYTLIEPCGAYRTFRLEKGEQGRPLIKESPGLFFGGKITALLEDCNYVTLLVSTIGSALPGKVDEAQKSDPSGSFFLEHVGGWMADYVADRLEDRIREEQRKNAYDPTMRYSPGYGDWTLDAQPELLRLLDAGELGITLTEAKIMVPRKSVSAVIGWTPVLPHGKR